MHSKKLILIIIDALATESVEPAVGAGRLPNFKRLKEAGRWQGDCTSIFPSITPAATGSLVSGVFPNEHGIGGAYWYVPETGDIEYFGDDIWAVLNRGATEYLRSFQQRLNYECFRARTVYEMVEEAGRESACLNYMWFKGPVEHSMEIPLPFKFLPGIPHRRQFTGRPMQHWEILSAADCRILTKVLRHPEECSAAMGFRTKRRANSCCSWQRRGLFPTSRWRTFRTTTSTATTSARTRLYRPLNASIRFWVN